MLENNARCTLFISLSVTDYIHIYIQNHKMKRLLNETHCWTCVVKTITNSLQKIWFQSNYTKTVLFCFSFRIKYLIKECMLCVVYMICLIFGVQRHFQQYFSYIMTTSVSGGRSIWRERPTLGMQPIKLITCDCESSAPYFVIYKAGREPTPYWW